MIIGAEIVTGIMIKIVVMIGNVTEIQVAAAVMILEVDIGHAPGPGNVLGIMIATGVMIGISVCKQLGVRICVSSYMNLWMESMILCLSDS
uniref:Uncharacterized protein n=1 Tax=Rhizophora mucronata TaxID=61149 RepID=A0A2P2LVE5_RHIMU